MSLTGGDAVVRTLAAHGVRHVFGIPGTHNLAVYGALRENGIEAVTTRHEQGAGYAADGYAQVAGRPGVVVTTSGPGLTNALTAAATSYAESRSVLLVSPGAPSGTVGADLGRLHETRDASGAAAALIGRSRRVETVEEVAPAIAQAFHDLAAGRPRPVHVEIALDALEGSWSGTPAGPLGTGPHRTPDAAAVSAAADLLAGAARPLLLLGGGARGAAAQARRLAEVLGAPVVTTCNGKGVLPESHPLSAGASVRLDALDEEARRSDVLLAVGTGLGEGELWGSTLAAGRLVRVDVDPDALLANRTPDVGLLGDAATVLDVLLEALPDGAPAAPDGLERAAALRTACEREVRAEAGPLADLHDALGAVLPDGTVLAGDSSQVTYRASAHLHPADAPGRFLYMPTFATLGYGLPAAIGAGVADPGRPVVAVLGDGALMFSVAELATAVELGRPLPVVVVDNGGYGEIREQELSRGVEPIAVDLHVPDLPALAQAFGGAGFEAGGPDEAAALVAHALRTPGPTLVRIRL